MMAQHCILANGSFVFLRGIRTSIAKKPYIFVIFNGRGGGSRSPVPPSGSTQAFVQQTYKFNITFAQLYLEF